MHDCIHKDERQKLFHYIYHISADISLLIDQSFFVVPVRGGEETREIVGKCFPVGNYRR